MRLVIGGRAQGKLATVLAEMELTPQQVCDGASCPPGQLPAFPVLDHLHLLIRRQMQAGIDPMDYAKRLIDECPKLIVISDEVGCGVVPIDREEREWREAVGRVCCLLAQRSERVDRVYAGILTCLKGA